MKEDTFLRVLESFPPMDYLREAMAKGRQELPMAVRAHASELYERVTHYLHSEPFLSVETNLTLELASRVLFSEWFLARHPCPRYQAYTNIRVLNWALETHRLMPLSQVTENAWRALTVMVRDLRQHELDSTGMEGMSPSPGSKIDNASLRLEKICRIESSLPHDGQVTGPAPATDGPLSWMDIACDPAKSLALARFTCLPQTRNHDEYLFIRTIHCSECCFWGVLASVIGAGEAAKSNRFAQGTGMLEEGLRFAKLLTPILDAMKTMHPASFHAFRDATGNASAIQSRTYQRMQISLLGLDPSKIGSLVEVPELSDLLLLDHPSFKPLKKGSALNRVGNPSLKPRHSERRLPAS
ncbi:MAG TPA: tryptophan 2,3-dioxygenase family protein [Holophaga sp.]|nr:tryptophan 2,3-dioxygenase family protein [Holophaga sp.]